MVSNEKDKAGGSTEQQVATLGGGCFWCLEAVFEQIRGVDSVVSGYSGGTVVNPSYQQVCRGGTGHAEVVQIAFNPRVITFAEILEVFFDIHNPTTLNRQGADVGTQYRSVIFTHDEHQKEVAEQMIREIDASGEWDGQVVTQVVPFGTFYEAEPYHQEYFRENPAQPYCRAVVAPKVDKFRKRYSAKLKR